MKAFQDATSAVDSTGLCVFTTFAWTLEDIAPQIDAAQYPAKWDVDRLLETGERIWNLERQFNLKAGFTKKDDTLPKRLLKDAAKTGPAEGKVNESRQDAAGILRACAAGPRKAFRPTKHSVGWRYKAREVAQRPCIM